MATSLFYLFIYLFSCSVFITLVTVKSFTSVSGIFAISGTDFIMSFPNYVLNSKINNTIRIYVSSPLNHDVHVNITAPEYKGPITVNYNFVLTPGTPREVKIKKKFRMPPGTTILPRTLVITASDLIDVVGSNRNGLDGDSFKAIPDNHLGNEYVAVSFKLTSSKVPKAATFVSVSAGIRSTSTLLTIRFPPWTNGERVFLNGSWYGARDCAEVRLRSLETLQIQTKHDLTGTFVRSSHPVAVYSGANRTVVLNFKSTCPKGSHLLDQMPPLDRAGYNFFLFDYPQRNCLSGSIYRVVATQDNTELYVFGKSKRRVLKQKGEAKRIYLPPDGLIYMNATKPVVVAHVSVSTSSDYTNKYGNPSLNVITPFEGKYQNASFSFGMLNTSYVTIITRGSVRNGMRLNNDPITTSWRKVKGQSAYKAATVSVSETFQPHVIYHINGAKFVAYLHSGDDCAAHGITLGFSPTVINPVSIYVDINILQYNYIKIYTRV